MRIERRIVVKRRSHLLFCESRWEELEQHDGVRLLHALGTEPLLLRDEHATWLVPVLPHTVDVNLRELVKAFALPDDLLLGIDHNWNPVRHLGIVSDLGLFEIQLLHQRGILVGRLRLDQLERLYRRLQRIANKEVRIGIVVRVYLVLVRPHHCEQVIPITPRHLVHTFHPVASRLDHDLKTVIAEGVHVIGLLEVMPYAHDDIGGNMNLVLSELPHRAYLGAVERRCPGILRAAIAQRLRNVLRAL